MKLDVIVTVVEVSFCHFKLYIPRSGCFNLGEGERVRVRDSIIVLKAYGTL